MPQTKTRDRASKIQLLGKFVHHGDPWRRSCNLKNFSSLTTVEGEGEGEGGDEILQRVQKPWSFRN